MGPFSQSDGHDSPRLIDDSVPSLAGGIEDILVGLEGAVGEVGLSQELPEVLDGVQFGRSRGKEEQGDVVWHLQLARGVPSGSVEQEDGVGAGYDVAGGRQVAYGRCERAWKVFLKPSSTSAFWAG